MSLMVVSVLLLSSCAGMATDGQSRQSDLITAEELATVNVNNLYQAIDRLRPRWLDVRSQQSLNTPTAVVVFQGQSMLGGVDVLREFGVDAAYAIRYLDGATASATLPGLGSRQVEGAIVINPSR